MGLRADYTVERQDPEYYDRVETARYEDITGRSQEFSAELRLIYPTYDTLLNNVYYWETLTYNQTIDEDFILETLYIGYLRFPVGGGTMAIKINGELIAYYDSDQDDVSVEFKKKKIYAGSVFSIESTTATANRGLIYLVGY